MRSTSRKALAGRIAAAALFMCASNAAAQNPLTVRVESAGKPLAGALVAIVNSQNLVVKESLSSSSGSVTLDAPAGEYRVRVRRIGYRPFYSDPLTVPRSSPLVLTVESPRIVLQQMVVSASSQCGKINPDAATLAELWEEISKALRASQLTMEDLRNYARAETYRREIDGDGIVLANESQAVPIARNRPFGSPDPRALVSLGYVRGNEAAGWQFFGPDERVLLSDQFASTHCFRATRDKTKPGMIGVAFKPVPKREQADIDGVLWIDEASSELREITFKFVNAGTVTRYKAGGYSKFSRVPSGAWIVNDWQLKMPRLVSRAGSSIVEASGFVETGGRLISVEEAAAPPKVDSAALVDQTLPRLVEWTRICGAPPDSAYENTKGIIHGYVRDETGHPIEKAAVTIFFREFKPLPTTSAAVYPLRVNVETGYDGHYTACGFKRMSVGTVSASYSGFISDRVDFNFDKSLTARRDLILKR
ncbi:MAG TPA: carboxypeptidase-like regulatory domain-containing protein [Gemmatimonadaceae bacterium]